MQVAAMPRPFCLSPRCEKNAVKSLRNLYFVAIEELMNRVCLRIDKDIVLFQAVIE